MRRRIAWDLEKRRATAVMPGEALPTNFSWDVRSWVSSEDGKQGDHFTLSWEGVWVHNFGDEPSLKEFLIRFVYGIQDNFLVPSELLADANVIYESEEWVDDWFSQRDEGRLIEAPRQIVRPYDRNIRLGEGDRGKIQQKRDNIFEKIRQFNQGRLGKPRKKKEKSRILSPVDVDPLTDEECYYVFPAGAKYQKSAAKATAESPYPLALPAKASQAQED